MNENPTIVNLAEVRRETATSTSSTQAEPQISSTAAGKPMRPSGQLAAMPPSDSFHSKAVWAAIIFIIGWLSWLSIAFYNESKELNNKISNNQEQIITAISSSQIDVKNQISDFERRHEVDIRELQKMILQPHNQKPQQVPDQ